MTKISAGLAEKADANLIEAFREHARWQQPGECLEEDGLLMVAGANAAPMAFRNCAVRTHPDAPATRVLERAQEFFRARNRGFVFILRASCDADLEQCLRSSGLRFTGEAPCMLIEAPVAESRTPAGVRVERFSEARHVEDAVAVNAEAYRAIKLPPEETRMYFNRPAALLSPRVAGFVAYRDGRPASTALTICSGESAGVYWVGTASGAQRAGLADTCTRLATNAGFASGASVVTLQATPFGEPLYRKLGFRTYDRILRFRSNA
jgi:ribosomal protein S18 acetylase RimI-like enzyme